MLVLPGLYRTACYLYHICRADIVLGGLRTQSLVIMC